MINVLYCGSGMHVEASYILIEISDCLQIPCKSLKLICVDPLDQFNASGYWAHENVQMSITGKYVEFHQINCIDYVRIPGIYVHLFNGFEGGRIHVQPGEICIRTCDDMSPISVNYFLCLHPPGLCPEEFNASDDDCF